MGCRGTVWPSFSRQFMEYDGATSNCIFHYQRWIVTDGISAGQIYFTQRQITLPVQTLGLSDPSQYNFCTLCSVYYYIYNYFFYWNFIFSFLVAFSLYSILPIAVSCQLHPSFQQFFPQLSLEIQLTDKTCHFSQ